MAQLGHALHKEKLDESAVVYVHWPKQRCHLLRDDVVLVDSPGIDVSQVGPMACRASEILRLGLTACGGMGWDVSPGDVWCLAS